MRNADFYLQRGLLSLKSRDYVAAAADLAQALQLNPKLVEAWVVRGNIRNAQGQPFDALLHYDSALQVNPDAADVWNNRGLAFADLGNWANAEVSFLKSAAIRDAVEPHMNLANLYAGLMQLDKATVEYRKAVAFEPDNYEAHLNLGVTLLGLGKWDEGFREYFWRHKGNLFPPRWARDYPQWQGEPLDVSMSLVLYPEQGYGDEILFMRVADWLRQKYPRRQIDLVVRTPLNRLTGDWTEGRYSFSCSTLDVVGLLGCTPFDMPAFTPYLKHFPTETELGPQRLPEGFKVGLCWESGQRPLQPDTAATSANKSIPLGMLRELLAVPGVTFVSLQKEHRDQQLVKELGLVDLMGEVHDFADTAALVDGLDLVISVDTAVAHLAGAMGKPVWNLVRYAGYWPWLHPGTVGGRIGFGDAGDTKSIWYPSMKLYRQPRLFDWSEPLARVKTDLLALVEERAAA